MPITAILECLRADFVASDFDLRRLITLIVCSETYQRSSIASDPAELIEVQQAIQIARVAGELFALARCSAALVPIRSTCRSVRLSRVITSMTMIGDWLD